MPTLKETLISDGMDPLLGQLQHLEVWNEVGNIQSTTEVQFAYDDWLTSRVPEVSKNRVKTTAGYAVDFALGKLTMTNPAVAGDEIRCSYTFQYFSNEDLGHFLDLSLSTMNSIRPQTSFTYEANSGAGDIPTQWYANLVELAYAHALETLLQDLMAWRAFLIFRDPNSVAGFLQGTISRIWNNWTTMKHEYKGRKYLTPQAIASGRWRFPRTVEQNNWQQFTVIRG